MKRVLHLFVPSLTGCLLVASLLSSCTSLHGSRSVPRAEAPPLDTSDTEPPPPSRVQVGIASWYGKKFHRRLTASGEVYDMYQPTAAHRTAPLGTYARVTNLENGQSVRVRINDRGPAIRRRILDLSYEAARQIDMVEAGLARVKVEFLPEALPTVQSSAMPVNPLPEEDPSTPLFQTRGARAFAVQVGSYHEQRHAVQTQQTLTTMYPNVWIAMAPKISQPLHRVRLGPFHDRQEAERVAREVKAHGYAAMLVSVVQ